MGPEQCQLSSAGFLVFHWLLNNIYILSKVEIQRWRDSGFKGARKHHETLYENG
jgi:hypothetical protein